MNNNDESKTPKYSYLNELLSLKESLQMPHLPETSNKKNNSLNNGPPQDSLICAFTCVSEPLLSVL